MILPSNFHFSQLDQMHLSPGTAAKLLTACLCGGVIGLEREARHKASGLRTNMLLCLGCACFTMLSPLIAGEGGNHAQIASNIVQGIGFLGAGLILHTRSRVLGLTSAATVFVVASIGMACGAGLYIEAGLATLIVLIALQFIGMLEGGMKWKRYPLLYEVRGTDAGQMYRAILRVMDHAGYRMNVIERDSLPGFERVTFVVTVNRHRHADLLAALRASDDTDQVVAFADTEQD
ncbi:putative Mg2+ transporter-C (MgtC) family protein [Granulicella rosea]|uniref:Putative Mg2+ transporter-C (MgtC) family protein n=1 Tax=Granulicella rosea TaxID=474952 RepID=A0A239KLC8_9BACT|nr:MgtC/SapB family protein [Granulicella rosea]SNT18522.1 putative Mg2+ transporter-C (MgtC) family protein [Granulicella rosea]